MKLNVQTLIIGVCAILIFGCRSNNNKLPASSGKTAELLVVADKQVFNGQPGEQVKKVFAEDMEMLPQKEPVFDIINVPVMSFDGMYKTFRNILIVLKNNKIKKPVIQISRDVWAQPQAVVKVSYSSDTDLTRLLYKYGGSLVSLFTDLERKRMINIFKGIETVDIRLKLNKDFGFGMVFPEGYYIAKKESGFAWIRKETENVSQNLIIYTAPYTDTNSFKNERILKLRDKITRNNIPGPYEGSYMIIENRISPVSKVINFKGNYAVETRGLWKLGGACCMGGPFVNYTFTDNSHNNVIALDAFVYAPGFNKRDFLLQIESIIHSFEFVKK